MTIIIDTPHRYRFRGRTIYSSHLLSDLMGAAGRAELVAFARSIGMKEKWIQKEGTAHEHFDVWGSRRKAALDAGARLVDRRELVGVFKAKRAHLCGHPDCTGEIGHQDQHGPAQQGISE